MTVRHDMITCFVARRTADRASYEILQMLRAGDDYAGNTWQVVRGVVESEETAISAVRRELVEETGIDVGILYSAGVIESFHTPHDDTIWHSAVFCLIVAHSVAIKLNSEHTDFRWVPCEEFDGFMMWPSERQVWPMVQEHILSHTPPHPMLCMGEMP